MTCDVFLLYGDILTCFGHGISCLTEALYQKRTGFRPVTRFHVSENHPDLAACFPDDLLAHAEGETTAEKAMRLLADSMPSLPPDIPFYFALTTGDSERMENPENAWTSHLLLDRVLPMLHRTQGRIYSGACASGNIALSRAWQRIASGKEDCILTAACDIVSEFNYSGFASLRAMSATICRPYDKKHDGLLLADSASVILLGNAACAEKYHLTPLAKITGAGIATDACHTAAPDPAGLSMKRAILKAMNGTDPHTIGAVIGHGTGTVLNDEMEIRALKSLFPDGIPLASVKGVSGHLLAVSGFAQLLCAAEVLKRNTLFPQTGLTEPAPDAEKFVSAEPQSLKYGRILSLNAGMGGLNAVLQIERAF